MNNMDKTKDDKEIYYFNKKTSEKIIIEGFDTLEDFRDYYVATSGEKESDVDSIVELRGEGFDNIRYFKGHFESAK